MRLISRLSLAALLLAFGGCAGLVRQEIYKPRTDPVAIASWTKTPPREVHVTASDGVSLQGFLWPGAPGNHQVIIFFHGRRAHQGVGAKYAQYLSGHGPAVLVASYRGFAGNRGSPSKLGLLRDGTAFVDYAKGLSGKDTRIFLVGHSLGAAVAVELAARHAVNGLVLIEPFATLSAVAPELARPFLVDRWDNEAAITSVSAPIVIFHGTADTVVPPAQAQRLFAATRGDAALIIMPGATHKPNMTALGPAISDAIELMDEGRLAALPTALPQGWSLASKPDQARPARLTP